MSKKSALKEMLFARFEQRRSEIIENRNKWQRELDEKVHEFGEAFGQEAVASLGNLTLSLHAGGRSKPLADSAAPQEGNEVTAVRKTRRRRRSSKKGPTIRSLLAANLPVAIAAVAERQDEFTTKDLHSAVSSMVGDAVSPANTSLYLSQNAKKLGLTAEKRLVSKKSSAGKSVPGLVNYYRLSSKKRKKG